MTAPVVGFRSWYVAKPKRVAQPDGDRVVVVRSELARAAFGLGHLAGDPEVTAWLEQQLERRRVASARLSRRYTTVPAPREPGTLLPLSSKKDDTWAEPGPVRFRCEKGHQRPDALCRCGLYAWLSPEQLPADGDVAGAIIAWGHLVIHGIEGFRAEHARIVALAPRPVVGGELVGKAPTRWHRMAAERLGVPCVPLNRLAEVAGEHGSPITWEYRFGE